MGRALTIKTVNTRPFLLGFQGPGEQVCNVRES